MKNEFCFRLQWPFNVASHYNNNSNHNNKKKEGTKVVEVTEISVIDFFFLIQISEVLQYQFN